MSQSLNVDFLNPYQPKIYKFWHLFCILTIILNMAGAGSLSINIGEASACVVGPTCGDNQINQSWEQCDGNAPQTCTTASGYEGTKTCSGCLWGDCIATQSCGDGTKNGPEECDDGNTANGDGCSSSCKTEAPCPVCGDGTVNQDSELCDNGDANGLACMPEYGSSCTYCSAICQPIDVTGPNCGDGMKNGEEECDGTDGVTANHICTAECKLEYVPYCGDGNLDTAEICEINATQACADDSGYNGVQSCNDGCSGWGQCVSQEFCGDGFRNDHEECDGTDGVPDHYVCTSECLLEYVPVCGDGLVNQCTEECDGLAGLPSDHYTCSNECKLTYIPYCGDKLVNQDSETCDDGNAVDGDGCSASCQIEVKPPVCGDGEKNQVSEQCDSGINNGLVCSAPYGGTCNYCTADCISATVTGPYCGDNIWYAGDPGTGLGIEECDGNAATTTPDHYACSSECKFVYQPYCGDNLINQESEECDGTAATTTPDHYTCSNECKFTYVPYCGDNILNQETEKCDKGAGNGKVCVPAYGQTCEYCSATCATSTVAGPFCGDNIKNGEEACDGTDGITDHTSCNSACQAVEKPTPPASGGGGGAVTVWFLNQMSNPSLPAPIPVSPTPTPAPVAPVVQGENGAPVLIIIKSVGQDFANPGEEGIEFNIIINNTGNMAAYDVNLTDTLPAGITFADGSTNPKTWVIGTILAGDMVRVAYRVNIENSAMNDLYRNVAEVSASNYPAVADDAKLEVRQVAVLAATGFNNFEFLAIILLVLSLAGASSLINKKYYNSESQQ